MKLDKEVIQMSRPLRHRATILRLSLGFVLMGGLLLGGCTDDSEPQRTKYLADESGRLYASDHVLVRAAPAKRSIHWSPVSKHAVGQLWTASVTGRSKIP